MNKTRKMNARISIVVLCVTAMIIIVMMVFEACSAGAVTIPQRQITSSNDGSTVIAYPPTATPLACHVMSAQQQCSAGTALLFWHHSGNGTSPVVQTPQTWTLTLSCKGIGSSLVTIRDMQRPITTIKVACDQLPLIATYSLMDGIYFVVVEPAQNTITITVR